MGPYVEVVFLHKQSKTLIVTDAVVCVPPTPPQVVRTANLLEAGSPLPGSFLDKSSILPHVFCHVLCSSWVLLTAVGTNRQCIPYSNITVWVALQCQCLLAHIIVCN